MVDEVTAAPVEAPAVEAPTEGAPQEVKDAIKDTMSRDSLDVVNNIASKISSFSGDDDVIKPKKPEGEAEGEEIETPPLQEVGGEDEVSDTDGSEVQVSPKIKAFAGEDVVEVPENLAFDVVVAGKPERVTIDDLKKNYSGKTNWDRKYQDLATERKKFQNDVAIVDKKLDRVYRLMETDPEKGLQELYRMAGDKSKDRVEKILAKAREKLERRESMTPEEIRLEEERNSLELEREAWENKRREEEETKEMESLGSELAQILKTHEIHHDEYKAAWEDILANAEAGHITIAGLTKRQLASLTLEQVGIKRVYNKIERGISKVDPKLVGDTGLISEIVNLMGTEASEDDIADIVRELYKKEEPVPVSTTSKDVAKAATKAKPDAPRKKEKAKDEDAEDEIRRQIRDSLSSALF